MGDRAFCSYEMLALLRAGGVESVMRLHQRRNAKRDWKGGKRIDADSRMVVWKKPEKKGKAGLSDQEWAALPDTIKLRYVRAKGEGRDGKPKTIYLVTTLLDGEDFPSDEIAEVFNQRWGIEVKIRDIKTTMKFETLRVKTPEMARRTLKMIQIAYNLVKARQREAIRGEAIDLGELGFKATLDLIEKSLGNFDGLVRHPRLLAKALADFEERLRERIIPIRPGRHEPRATKTRPKPFQYLTKPRGEFTEIQHRGRYRKAA